MKRSGKFRSRIEAFGARDSLDPPVLPYVARATCDADATGSYERAGLTESIQSRVFAP